MLMFLLWFLCPLNFSQFIPPFFNGLWIGDAVETYSWLESTWALIPYKKQQILISASSSLFFFFFWDYYIIQEFFLWFWYSTDDFGIFRSLWIHSDNSEMSRKIK